MVHRCAVVAEVGLRGEVGMSGAVTLLAPLLGQSLCRIQVCEPWATDRSSIVLGGALVLGFSGAALVCLSPLRYMRSQAGTAAFCEAMGHPVSLGFRANVCEADLVQRFKALVNGPCDEPHQLLPPPRWINVALGDLAAVGQRLVQATLLPVGSSALSRLELTFNGGMAVWLTYRLDLDGSIQLGLPGSDHVISTVAPAVPNDPFGWLLDEAPAALCIDGRRWKNVREYGAGFSARVEAQLAGTMAERNESWRRVQGRVIKYRTYPSLWRRFQAIRYPLQNPQLGVMAAPFSKG